MYKIWTACDVIAKMRNFWKYGHDVVNSQLVLKSVNTNPHVKFGAPVTFGSGVRYDAFSLYSTYIVGGTSRLSVPPSSSVASGGGGSSPPIGLKSMQNSTIFVLLKPIFAPKMKTAPPKGFGSRSCEELAVV